MGVISRSCRVQVLVGWMACVGMGSPWLGLLAQDDAVRRGRDAFSSQGDWTWYDSQSDSLVPLQPPAPGTSRRSGGATGDRGSGSGWGSGDGTNGSPDRGRSLDIPEGSIPLDGLAPIFNAIAWVVVALAVLALVVGIIYALTKIDWSRDETDDEETPETDAVELSPAEKLPFDLDESISNFLDAAHQAYQAGDLRKATIYLFSHTLLSLDQHRWIRLTRGKTNRQYLNEIRDAIELKRFYERVMIIFEDAFFGNRQISLDQFEACWIELDRFHANVKRPDAISESPRPGQLQPTVS